MARNQTLEQANTPGQLGKSLSARGVTDGNRDAVMRIGVQSRLDGATHATVDVQASVSGRPDGWVNIGSMDVDNSNAIRAFECPIPATFVRCRLVDITPDDDVVIPAEPEPIETVVVDEAPDGASVIVTTVATPAPAQTVPWGCSAWLSAGS